MSVITPNVFRCQSFIELEANTFQGKFPQDYAVALAHQELEWIKEYSFLKSADDPFVSSAAQNNPRAHISLLQIYLEVARYLCPRTQILSRLSFSVHIFILAISS